MRPPALGSPVSNVFYDNGVCRVGSPLLPRTLSPAQIKGSSATRFARKSGEHSIVQDNPHDHYRHVLVIFFIRHNMSDNYNYDVKFADLMRNEQTAEEMDLAKQEKAYESARVELAAQKETLQKNYQALVGRRHENELLQVVARDYADYYEKIKKRMAEVNERMVTINQYLQKVIQENQTTDFSLTHLIDDKSNLSEKIEETKNRINDLVS